MTVIDRFLKLVSYPTTSDENSETCPSTPRQLALAEELVRQMQEKFYNNCYQVEMTNPDFTKIAEAYDLFAVRVRTKEELIPALEKAIRHQGTAIVDIVIDSFENI